tara:strand:+ start:650 stop:802 length:153 start_codon:yes stop_codon:yes gene_type:complete
MAKNDDNSHVEKQIAIAAQTFQQLESISTELKRLNDSIDKYLKFNHIGDE